MKASLSTQRTSTLRTSGAASGVGLLQGVLVRPPVGSRRSTPWCSQKQETSSNPGIAVSRSSAVWPRARPAGTVRTRASTPSTSASGGGQDEGSSKAIWVFLGGLVLFGLAAAAALSTPHGMSVKDALVNGPLGRSGFLAAFSLIFLSELGDKTFFIAALLAMKLGKWVSFAGSLASLALMTVISVAIGVVIGKAPDAFMSSIPVGEIAGILLLVVFGVKALREGLKPETGHSGADEEMAEADEAVKQAEQGGKVRRDSNWVQNFLQVASLIFIAEWGDRSMLATIALGAAQNPVGVCAGATTGHAIATGIAVVGGALTAQHISEKQVNIVSGVLFLLFAAATAWTMVV